MIPILPKVKAMQPYTVRDKVLENKVVMTQIANNSPEQAMIGDFPKAVDDAIFSSHEAHKEQMMQLLSDPKKAEEFARVVFDMLQDAEVIQTNGRNYN
ncbi:hypothetical protein MTBBW1_400035 [Desulfamplus magnetovallimortis]|uniref:Uncharacterized protein n=1 Tax=Desulfamplus magnetovallimortis TaxID=1246637 RepID=A0A1W1HGW7_9BACT|nr:hypothetical protein [Desulfamplus magnetovallimortis]SLM31628.1 hypothetical protein MTBBW1_400035 [Desulfamplus magnetovallimortis]